MIDWIQGEKFMNLANNENIFYCHTHDVIPFLKNMENHTPYILITHNSDVCVDMNVPENVIRWYAQNVNIDDSKIESIPIGLENNKWFPEINKQKVMYEFMTKEKRGKQGLLYVNNDISTNPIERQRVYDIFEQKCDCWCTVEYGKNGKDFTNYIEKLHKHYFVACPEGNGIDTVRLWETLYMDSIPIVKRNINTSYYTDLPICYIDDWEEVNEEFLIREYSKIKGKNWNYKKLLFGYWKNLILDEKNK